MHLEELKELNVKLFAGVTSARTERERTFEERVYAKVRDMSFKSETTGFLGVKEFNVGTPTQFNDMVKSVNQQLLPYFELINLSHQVRINAINQS